jgi:hypothetical protein
MITREQVADLQPGDVVEVASEEWPAGTVVRGPLWMQDGETLQVARTVVRHWDGHEPFDTGLTLTVVSRAPRPLYVDSDKTEPDPGDVVRDADDGRSLSAWLYGRSELGIMAWRGTVTGVWHLRDILPARLRLLVDGETGQVVP